MSCCSIAAANYALRSAETHILDADTGECVKWEGTADCMAWPSIDTAQRWIARQLTPARYSVI